MKLEIYEEIERNFLLINRQIRNIETSNISTIIDDLHRTKQLEERVGRFSGIPYNFMKKSMSTEQIVEWLKSLNMEKAINRTSLKINKELKKYK